MFMYLENINNSLCINAFVCYITYNWAHIILYIVFHKIKARAINHISKKKIW